MDSEVVASLHKHHRTTLERIEKYISDTYFTDVNLRGKVYPAKTTCDEILHWKVPGGEGSWQNWTFSEVVAQNFTPVSIGASFGPTWTTHWFRVRYTIPVDWKEEEVVFVWKSQSEAMVWSSSGEPLQGLSTGTGHQMRSEFPLKNVGMVAGNQQELYIEMACNNMFGAGKGGLINPTDEDHQFVLEAAELRIFDREVYSLVIDLQILHDLAKHLPDDHRGYEALYMGNHMINAISTGSQSIAKQVAADFYGKSKNGSKAHCLALMGHCHIDCAWLWPYSESKRKCARSWSSTLALLDQYPNWVFTCSQAQQFVWVQKCYPALFKKIKNKVREGRFIPVGGTWVEMDGLLPSGESFMRQFLYGQQYFLKEFGVKCKEFWLPDTFGYSAQLPQICKLFGIKHFLTQKLSWSLVNKFPHHNFHWEGIDGSCILAHFPPGDSYEMNVTVEEAMKTVSKLKDKGRVGMSAFLFGFGDGGGGPTADMLERASRLKDVDGCPRMEHRTPDAFFSSLELESKNLCKWVGELYLELHNGTYTSQAKTKKQNRIAEFRLRSAELLLSMVVLKKKVTMEQMQRYQDKLERAWKDILLNQFHDVLPGSSIELVYRDSNFLYEEAIETAEAVAEESLDLLNEGSFECGRFIFNSQPWKVEHVLQVKSLYHSNAEEADSKRQCLGRMQTASNGEDYVHVVCNGIGFSHLQAVDCPPVTISESNGTYTVSNSKISATISPYGIVESLFVIGEPNSEVLGGEGGPGIANQLMIFDDIPLFWDAWDVMDYHLETGRTLNSKQYRSKIDCVTVVESGPLVVKLRWKLAISKTSFLTQDIELVANCPYLTFHTSVDWFENRKFLKMKCDTTIHCNTASFDIQFGHIERPTHVNTSWDAARFEVCGHKWADISQHGLGLAVLNDCKYGWMARGNSITLSLLRSPKGPDGQCDMGTHTFKYALMPHRGSLQEAQVVRRSYEFNNPVQVISNLKTCPGDEHLEMFFGLDTDGAVIDAVKLSEDRTGDIVVRLHEIHGGKCNANVSLPAGIDIKRVSTCDGLEDPLEEISFEKMVLEEDVEERVTIPLHLSPFQIQTLRIYL